MEKSILRKAFDPEFSNCGEAYLPKDILWR